MKIATTLIVLLGIITGINMYSSFTEKDRLETALRMLDERISRAEDNVLNVSEYVGNTIIDFERMEHMLENNIASIANQLEKHEHEKVYIQPKEEPKPIEKIEVPAVKITTETPVVKKEISIERIYDPVTELHVPNITTIPLSPAIVSCPNANNRLNKYISKLNIRRDYKFLVTYDIIDDTITNVRFDNKVPSNLQGAVRKFINSFTRYGDVEDCKISIKVLEN